MDKVHAGCVEISIDQLKLGWIADCDIFAEDQVLLRKGAVVNARILATLKSRGLNVIQAASSSMLASPPADPRDEILNYILSSPKQVYTKHKVVTAVPKYILQETSQHLESCFSQIETGSDLNMDEVKPPVSRLVGEFLSRPECAVKLLDLENVGKYIYFHSLNVCMLILAVARDWVDLEQLKEVAFGAVLHDLGMAKISSRILNKQEKLSEDEWRLVQQHPKWSAEYLMAAGASMEAISIAYGHHERIDGAGYPMKKNGADLSRLAKLAAIADVYDALTSERAYRPRLDFARAIDLIITSTGTRFDAEIANLFIRKIGRYPAGTFVRLSTGEVAVVVKTNDSAISRPVVSRILNADGEELTQGEELDLSYINDIHIKEFISHCGFKTGAA